MKIDKENRAMRTVKIKTIDIEALEWRDRVNGNSYFAAKVTLNFGMRDQRSFSIPFQYGYGDYYKTAAMEELQTRGYIKANDRDILWRYCQENNVILRASKQAGCLKRDLINI